MSEHPSPARPAHVRRAPGFLVAALVAAGVAGAQNAAARPAPSATIETLEGQRIPVTGLTVEGTTVTATVDGATEPTTFALADLARLDRRAKTTEAPAWSGPLLGLRSGGVLPVELVPASDGGDMTYRVHPARTAVVIPRIHIAWLRLADAPITSDGGFAADARDHGSDPVDRIYARRGTDIVRVSRAVDGIRSDPAGVAVRGVGRVLELDRVYGVVFGADTGVAPDPLPEPTVEVSLGSTTVRGSLVSLDAETTRLRLAEGPTLVLPSAHVREVRVRSDKQMFLSDLEPAVEQTPAFDRVWPVSVDRAPAGEGIALGGRTFGRGLVLVPRTRLKYALDGSFAVFEATIGIEDRAGPLGDAVFRVLGDGEVLFDSGAVRAADAPRDVAVDIAGVRELVLEADFGAGYDLGDHCVFARARVRKL